MSTSLNLAIEINHLEFAYSKDPIIKIPKLEINQGASVFLYGPSGCGKSTLLSLLTGTLSPQSGNIKMMGSNIGSMPERVRDQFRGKNIGYIFQSFNLIPYLSVLENVLLPFYSGRKVQSPIEEANSLIRKLGLEDCLHKSVLHLSVGQRQRVAVARALLGSPPLIIADEPTSSLDEEAKNNFISLLMELKSPRETIFFVSHDQTLASQFGQQLSLMQINEA